MEILEDGIRLSNWVDIEVDLSFRFIVRLCLFCNILPKRQVLKFEDVLLSGVKGFVLVVHPDFVHGYPLDSEIMNYGYFLYATNEALHLSEREEKSIMHIISNISKEIADNMDSFTQDLLISNLDLLLKYCDRFYNRQFLTRKKVNSDLLTKLEGISVMAIPLCSMKVRSC